MQKRALQLVSHHLCPYVQRAAIALLEKGMPFERVMIDLRDKPAWFKVMSPLGKVPLLRVARPGKEDAILFESKVICEYIEETESGPRLHPQDPLDRAQHRAWMEFGSSTLSDIWGLETAREPQLFDAKRQALREKFMRLEAVLGEGPYFAGEAFSLVDAVFGPIFRYFDLFDRLADHRIFTGLPRLGAWRVALAARPSVQAAAVPDYEERLRAFLLHHDAHLLKLAA